ncbi:hypothetical protein [Massilia cavernae]|uniref:Uncharacterized protein n=1 Tax=Massilia cavernae TaxID=2320864 RepID=A0A418XAF1_9BURK|nr:hypothetical protein [Massilia cavernae]RJG09454.1 hypothetical protein D3872_22705 [Massilia cavernae]
MRPFGSTAAGDVINDATDNGFNWKGVADQYGAVILAPNATGNASSGTDPEPSPQKLLVNRLDAC